MQASHGDWLGSCFSSEDRKLVRLRPTRVSPSKYQVGSSDVWWRPHSSILSQGYMSHEFFKLANVSAETLDVIVVGGGWRPSPSWV